MQFLSQCCYTPRNFTTDAIAYGETVANLLAATGAMKAIKDQHAAVYPEEAAVEATAAVVAAAAATAAATTTAQAHLHRTKPQNEPLQFKRRCSGAQARPDSLMPYKPLFVLLYNTQFDRWFI